MPLAPAIHLVGSGPMPAADRIIYADGSAEAGFRPGADLELSHWIPNTTPPRWRADTSTETCFRFADDPDGEFDLAVNNHADVDGTMSLFVLTHTEFALRHRDTIVGAAEVGDFRAWAERPAIRLAQEIELYLHQNEGTDLRQQYEDCFAIAVGVLDGSMPESPEIEAILAHVQRSADMIDDGTVRTNRIDEHFVSFVTPTADGAALERMLAIQSMGVVSTDVGWLPHGRNRDYPEDVKLVSVPSPDGWFHDLWYPGYSWAETPDRWTPPGLPSSGTSLVLDVSLPRLDEAIDRLNQLDKAPGQWVVSAQLTPFTALAGRSFPVVASHLTDDNAPAPSTLDADTVAAELKGVWG